MDPGNDKIFLEITDGLIWVRLEFEHEGELNRVSVPLTWREALHLGEHLMKSASTLATNREAK
jgi:hypothetical protein